MIPDDEAFRKVEDKETPKLRGFKQIKQVRTLHRYTKLTPFCAEICAREKNHWESSMKDLEIGVL